MGRSYTIHCIGVPQGSAMSRLELMQEHHKAIKRNQPIRYWFAQTKVGMKILKTYSENEVAPTAGLERQGIINLRKLVTCPICQGEGRNGKYYCPVCNGSGICKPRNEKNWRAWQLESMMAARIEVSS